VLRKIIVLLALIVLIFSCAGNKPKSSMTADEYFEFAMEEFENEDFFEANQDFTVIVFRFPGSTVADSAQFYLAETHYSMDEYLIAASEFEKLVTDMPNSSLVPKAQYRLAESYEQMSPRAELDQSYTLKSIRAYQTFIEDYPRDSHKEAAEQKILELRNKLALKDFKSATIYRKMNKFKAAIIYYDSVLKEYFDSEWADDAMYGKIITYIEMGDINSAKAEKEKFIKQFPNSDRMSQVEHLGELKVAN
jgi:outer membrane protein assembly factor BamD